MEKVIDVIKTSRRNFIKLIDGLSLDTLNEIPAGFNNNLVWHLGHLVASQQILCYQFANQKPLIEEKYILKYKNGTKPEAYVDQEEFDILKNYFTTLIDQLEKDLSTHLFDNYNSYVSPTYGIEIRNITDVVKYVSFHEGFHLGYATAIRRLVRK
ncbi:DinB family protein [Cytophagaceae bacterium DM2B3-1]|uniref:DinB family protein n=1 Tax=Xanthocytophaga flava TaxID=3048013 RepID=A0ABT7CN63_9BACT|nr:DinB family protein [Xanthocytophaga flavus]MDJ1495179.1 DinB family protein [Xanthocytophaga flavus]